MPSLEDIKFSFNDFASFEAIDKWWSPNNPEKDKEGYTPIGAAVLNGAPLECIAYLMQLYTFNGSPESSSHSKENPFRDITNDISKGRSPIGVACLTMNADAIDVLRNNYYEYVLKDEDGNPIPKLDHYGDPIDAEKYVMYTSVPLLNEYTKESYKYSKEQKLSEVYEDFPQYKACKDTDADWLTAAALPKADILVKLIPKIPYGSIKYSFNDILDDNGNTLILLACVAGCHESVEHIRDNCSNFNNIATINDENPDQIFIKNSDGLTAFDVALESQDTDLLSLLLGDQISDDFIKQLLIKYFSEKANKNITGVLIKLITSEHIYEYYIEGEYEYGYSDDPDHEIYRIIEYIEKENSTSLFNLLLPKYNNPNESYRYHLNEFFSNMCSNIIAFLYKKSCVPFNSASPTENLNSLLNFHNSELYVDIVEVLFKSGHIILKQICDISEEQKRCRCVDKIFTTTYNKQLFVQLLKVDSDNRDEVLAYLYNDKHYFTLQHIAELQGDQSLGKPDEFLFDIIYELVGNNVAIIESDIDSAHNQFKIDYCVYLYISDKVTITGIIDSSCSSEFKCAIINKLYNNGFGNLKLDDIYHIYNNYDDDLSDLNRDLKPLVGCRKFIDSDEIASDFYWAYSFGSYVGNNWFNPTHYQNSTPPITDTSLKPVDGVRYKSVLLSDNINGSKFNPTRFRLAVYRNAPEFYTDSVYSATSKDNGMIVSFNKSVVSYTFQLPEDMYTINNGNEITWNTEHPLYTLLLNNKCYNDSDVLATILFNKDHASITEGMSITRNFRLSAKPKDNVVLNINSSKPERLHVSSNELIFTPTNWDVDQEITFIAVNDSIDNDNISVTIIVSADSSDTRYNELTDSSLYFTVVDNDVAGINYIASSIDLTEGTSVTRSFRLNTKPSSDVVIRVSSDSSNRLSISPTALTFTPENWYSEKVVVFRALDNYIYDGDASCTVTLSVESQDESYNLISIPSISAIIRDNDTIVFGKLAFESDYFAVDTDPTYTLPYVQKGTSEPFDNTTPEYQRFVKDQWSSVYVSDTDYAVYQVPRSPKPGNPFEYDLIYDEHINVDD